MVSGNLAYFFGGCACISILPDNTPAPLNGLYIFNSDTLNFTTWSFPRYPSPPSIHGAGKRSLTLEASI